MTIELLTLTYSMTIGTILAIYHKQIINQLKKSIKQYIEYTEDIPLEFSVGK